VQGCVYKNGELLSPDAATVSVFDRGFLYGDSVYETLRVYGGRPFALERHLERLAGSGERIGFDLPWGAAHIAEAVRQTVERAGLDDAYVRVIATRGSGAVSLDPGLAVEPQLLVIALPLPPLPDDLYTAGRHAWIVEVLRNAKRALDPGAKTGNYMNSVLALRDARSHGADDAIMLDREGRVTEASSANVFARVNGVWCTPPLEVGILSGITRRTLLEIADDEGIAAEERHLRGDDLLNAEEVFFCSSVRELLPIVRINGQPIADGAVGEHTKAMHRLYRKRVSDAGR